MVVTKTDLSTNLPTSSAYTSFATGDTVDALTTNANNNAWLSLITLIYNYCIDQTPQTAIATTYTAQQSFAAGIKTDTIESYTANHDIDVTTTSTGKFNYNAVEVATQNYVQSYVASVGNISLNYSFGGIKNGTFTAIRGFVYLIDTSGGIFTGTLPLNPTQGDMVGFVDIKGTWNTNNFTIGRNSQSIMDSATDLVCDVNYATVYLMFTTTTGWYRI